MSYLATHPEDTLRELRDAYEPLYILGVLGQYPPPQDTPERREWEERLYIGNGLGRALEEFRARIFSAGRDVREWLERHGPGARTATGDSVAMSTVGTERPQEDDVLRAIRAAVRPVAALVAAIDGAPDFEDRHADVAEAAARSLVTLDAEHEQWSGFPGDIELELCRAEAVLSAVHAMSLVVTEGDGVRATHPAYLSDRSRLYHDAVTQLAFDAWQRWRPKREPRAPKADAPDPETIAAE